MTISVVHTTASNTLTTTIPSTTAGNCLVVCINSFSTGAQSVSGVTLGGVADNFAGLKTVGGGANAPLTAIWADPNCAGGQTSVVVAGTNLNPGSGDGGIVIFEISGLVASSVLDKSASATGSSAAFSSGATATTTVASEIFIGTADAAPTIAGPASPWTNTVNAGSAAVAGWQVVSSTGAATYAGTCAAGTWSAAVVTLKSPAAAVAGTVQPQATVPVPRRKPGRALWQRITGQAFVAVAAPVQQPAPAPRRKPARAIWHGITGQAFVKVAAPVQQPAPAPRRRPARAVIRFTPVATTNAVPAPPVNGTVQSRATLVTTRRRPARAVIPVPFVPLIPFVPVVTEGGPVYYPYHHRGRGRTR